MVSDFTVNLIAVDRRFIPGPALPILRIPRSKNIVYDFNLKALTASENNANLPMSERIIDYSVYNLTSVKMEAKFTNIEINVE